MRLLEFHFSGSMFVKKQIKQKKIQREHETRAQRRKLDRHHIPDALLINFTPKLVSVRQLLAAFLLPRQALLQIVTHYHQFTAELISGETASPRSSEAKRRPDEGGGRRRRRRRRGGVIWISHTSLECVSHACRKSFRSGRK